MSPRRIQRTEGWKPSKSAVWVGPRSNFYNPFAAKIRGGESGLATMTRQNLVDDFREWLTKPIHWSRTPEGWTWVTWGNWDSLMGVKYADRFLILDKLETLRGKDLVCRCPLSQPCHADVLLEMAEEPDLNRFKPTHLFTERSVSYLMEQPNQIANTKPTLSGCFMGQWNRNQHAATRIVVPGKTRSTGNRTSFEGGK